MEISRELDALYEEEEGLASTMLSHVLPAIASIVAACVSAVVSCNLFTMLTFTGIVKFLIIPWLNSLIDESDWQFAQIRKRRRELVSAKIHHSQQNP